MLKPVHCIKAFYENLLLKPVIFLSPISKELWRLRVRKLHSGVVQQPWGRYPGYVKYTI